MKRSFFYAVGGSLVASFLAAGPVSADSIDFSQFGPPGTVLPATITGVTTGGVSVTLTSPQPLFGFETLVEGPGSWQGTFPSGAPLLFDGGSGAVTLMFADSITSLTLAAQANLQGDFVETIDAYNGTTLVDMATSGILVNCADLSCEGTQAFLTVAALLGITRVTVSTTHDDAGFALYGGAGAPTPLPGALPLFVTGLGALALLGWRRKRKAAAKAV